MENEKTPQEQLQRMVRSALRLYRRALRGEQVTVAAQKAAADVLKAAGLIGDNAAAPSLPANIRVSFLPMRLDDDGNPIVTNAKREPGTTPGPESNSGGPVTGEVQNDNGGSPVGQDVL